MIVNKTNNILTPIVSFPDSLVFQPTDDLLYEFDRLALWYGSMLADSCVTFQRIEEGYALVYGVDFDIIFAYANPWSASADRAGIIEFLVEDDVTPLALLPGTVEELLQYLRATSKQRFTARHLIAKLHAGKANDDTIEKAKKLINDDSFGDIVLKSDVDLEYIAHLLIECINKLDYAGQRIEKFLNLPRLIPLSTVFGSQDDTDLYNESVFRRLIIDLAARRRGEGYRIRNEADARNIATICQHAERIAKIGQAAEEGDNDQPSRYCLRLLTNTRTIIGLPLVLLPRPLHAALGHACRTEARR